MNLLKTVVLIMIESYGELKTLRLANRKSLILGYINIDSIRNKIEQLKPILSNSLDVITIAETKIDDTFPTSQFVIEDYMKPFRYDRGRYGGGLLVYVKEGLPAKQLYTYKFPNNIEVRVVEHNLKKQNGYFFVCIDHRLNAKNIFSMKLRNA